MHVELRSAKLPWIGQLAVHYWFVIVRPGRSDRWEVWQTAELKQPAWGHLHHNLMAPNNGVGNGDSVLEITWQGATAMALVAPIEASPTTYPYRYRYCFWPGPNSNTYVQWVLAQAQIPFPLSWKGWGKDYPLAPS